MQKRKGQRARAKKGADLIIEVDVRAVVALAVTVVMCLFCALSLFLYARTFIGIKRFELVGVSRYDQKDIINASRLKLGDRLYTLDLDEVEEQILLGCPYLETVKISRRFPHTIRFSVEERAPQWYIELAGDYYVLDADLVVMTEVASEDMLKQEGVTRLSLPNLTRVMQGELPVFGMTEGERDETEIRKTLEVISAVRKSSFKSRITALDLSNRFSMTMTVDDRYYVSLGDMTALEAKLREVEAILNSEKAKQYPSAEIDVSAPGVPASFKPIT